MFNGVQDIFWLSNVFFNKEKKFAMVYMAVKCSDALCGEWGWNDSNGSQMLAGAWIFETLVAELSPDGIASNVILHRERSSSPKSW